MPPEETPPPPSQRRRRAGPDARDSRPVDPDEPPLLNPPPDVPEDHHREMAEDQRGRNRGLANGVRPRHQRFADLNQAAMEALIDGDIPDRLLRAPLSPNPRADPVMQILRRVLDEETAPIRRLGLTDRMAREMAITALGTLYARAKAGDAKCAMWLGDKFLEPYLTSFSQAVSGLQEPEVNEGIRATLSSLGVRPELIEGVLEDLERQAPQRTARAAATAATDDLLEEVRQGAASLPVILDDDNQVILPGEHQWERPCSQCSGSGREGHGERCSWCHGTGREPEDGDDE